MDSAAPSMPVPRSPEPRLRAELEDFVRRHVERLAPLQTRSHEASWRASTTGDPGDEEAAARLETEVRSLYAEAEPFRRLRGWQAAGGSGEPALDRQLTLLVNTYWSNQTPADAIERMVRLEKTLESRFNNFRAAFRGERVTDNRLREVLASEPEPEPRREAWEASKQIGAEVRDELLGLVALRNEAARANGFPDYYTMMLTLDELDPARLFATLERTDRLTRDSFRIFKSGLDRDLARRYRCAADELRPWHYGDPFFQEAPRSAVAVDHLFANADLVAVARAFFSALEFDIEPILARSDLYERPGKSQHAFCTDIDRAGDVRILCNLRPNEFWMGTLLHELGHAIYDRGIDGRLPYLLRSHAHVLCTEAVAMLMGRLSKRGVWLERYLRVPQAEAAAVEARLGRALRGQLLVQTRWCLVMAHFERRLYGDPACDLDTLWWDLVERFQEVKRPEGRQAPDWAAKIHLSVAPVYYHNYLLGEMMASQLESHLLDRALGGGDGAWRLFVGSPRVGAELSQRLFAPGRTRDWMGTLQHATGHELDPELFASGLQVAPAE